MVRDVSHTSKEFKCFAFFAHVLNQQKSAQKNEVFENLQFPTMPEFIQITFQKSSTEKITSRSVIKITL